MEELGTRTITIVVKSLSFGSHQFDFQLDKGFFDGYLNEDIVGAHLAVAVRMQKVDNVSMHVEVGIQGVVDVVCDRCLDALELPISYQAALTQEEVDEAWDTETGELDLSQYVYDSVCVSMPIKKTHEPGGCNPKMMDFWKQNSGQTSTQDGAFDALKDLYNNN